jgi:ABC-type nitrate/sulfonate/bicarbonate transport system ATPase subunit
MIRVTSGSFSFSPGNEVLRQVTFSVETGELCFLVGASGSGKSTLLRILAGLLPDAERGELEHLDGTFLLDGLDPKAFRKTHQTGFVFQDYRLLPFLNVVENVAWPLKRRQGSEEEYPAASEKAREVLERLGLAHKALAFPHSLSGGMKARVALARALVTEPKLLLIDEAFSALDIGWRAIMYRLVADLRRMFNLTAIVVSHDLADVAELADHVLVLAASGNLGDDITLPQNAGDGRLDVIRAIQDAILKDHPAMEAG